MAWNELSSLGIGYIEVSKKEKNELLRMEQEEVKEIRKIEEIKNESVYRLHFTYNLKENEVISEIITSQVKVQAQRMQIQKIEQNQKLQELLENQFHHFERKVKINLDFKEVLFLDERTLHTIESEVQKILRPSKQQFKKKQSNFFGLLSTLKQCRLFLKMDKEYFKHFPCSLTGQEESKIRQKSILEMMNSRSKDSLKQSSQGNYGLDLIPESQAYQVPKMPEFTQVPSLSRQVTNLDPKNLIFSRTKSGGLQISGNPNESKEIYKSDFSEIKLKNLTNLTLKFIPPEKFDTFSKSEYLLRSLQFCESEYETGGQEEHEKFNYHSSNFESVFYFTIQENGHLRSLPESLIWYYALRMHMLEAQFFLSIMQCNFEGVLPHVSFHKESLIKNVLLPVSTSVREDILKEPINVMEELTNNSSRLRAYLEHSFDNIKEFKYLSINIKAIQVEFHKAKKYDDDMTSEVKRTQESEYLPLIDQIIHPCKLSYKIYGSILSIVIFVKFNFEPRRHEQEVIYNLKEIESQERLMNLICHPCRFWETILTEHQIFDEFSAKFDIEQNLEEMTKNLKMGNKKLEIMIDWEGLEKVFKVISLGRDQKSYKELQKYYDEKYNDFENLLAIKGQSDLENFFVNLFNTMTKPTEENVRKIFNSSALFTHTKPRFRTQLNSQIKEDAEFDYLFDSSPIQLPVHRESEKKRKMSNEEVLEALMNVFLVPVHASELNELCEAETLVLILREEQSKFHLFQFKSFNYENNLLSVVNLIEDERFSLKIEEISVSLIVSESWPSSDLMQSKIGDLMATDQNLMCYKPSLFYNYGQNQPSEIGEQHPSNLYIPKSVSLKFKLEARALERCKEAARKIGRHLNDQANQANAIEGQRDITLQISQNYEILPSQQSSLFQTPYKVDLLSNGIFRHAVLKFEHFLKENKFQKKFELDVDYSFLETEKTSVLIAAQIIESALQMMLNGAQMAIAELKFIPPSAVLDATLRGLKGVRVNLEVNSSQPYLIEIQDGSYFTLSLALEKAEDEGLDLSRRVSRVQIEEKVRDALLLRIKSVYSEKISSFQEEQKEQSDQELGVYLCSKMKEKLVTLAIHDKLQPASYVWFIAKLLSQQAQIVEFYSLLMSVGIEPPRLQISCNHEKEQKTSYSYQNGALLVQLFYYSNLECNFLLQTLYSALIIAQPNEGSYSKLKFCVRIGQEPETFQFSILSLPQYKPSKIEENEFARAFLLKRNGGRNAELSTASELKTILLGQYKLEVTLSPSSVEMNSLYFLCIMLQSAKQIIYYRPIFICPEGAQSTNFDPILDKQGSALCASVLLTDTSCFSLQSLYQKNKPLYRAKLDYAIGLEKKINDFKLIGRQRKVEIDKISSEAYLLRILKQEVSSYFRVQHMPSNSQCLIVSQKHDSKYLKFEGYEKYYKFEQSPKPGEVSEEKFFEYQGISRLRKDYEYEEKKRPRKKEENKEEAGDRAKYQKLFVKRSDTNFILIGYCYEKEKKKVEYRLLKEKYRKKQIQDQNLKDRERILDYIFDVKSREAHGTVQTIEQYYAFMKTHGGYSDKQEYEEKMRQGEVSESIFRVRIKEEEKVSDAGKLRVEKLIYNGEKFRSEEEVRKVEFVFQHSHLLFARYKAIVAEVKEGVVTLTWSPQYRGNYILFVNGERADQKHHEFQVLASWNVVSELSVAQFIGEDKKEENEEEMKQEEERLSKYRKIEASSACSILVNPRDKWWNPLGKLEFKKHQYSEKNGDLVMESGTTMRLSVIVTHAGSGEKVDVKDYEIKYKFQKVSGFTVQFIPSIQLILKRLELVVKLNQTEISKTHGFIEVSDLSFEKKLKMVKEAVWKFRRGENTLRVSRFSLLQDLKKLEPRVFKKKPFVKFQGETAYDAGGPRKDFFTFVTREFTSPENKLFLSTSEETMTIHPLSSQVQDYEKLFRMCGAFYACAVVYGYHISFPLAENVFKYLLDQPVHAQDYRKLDQVAYSSIVSLAKVRTEVKEQMEKEEIENLFLNFTVSEGKEGETRELCEKGTERDVTQENVKEYIELMCKWKVRGCYEIQLKNFKTGFSEVIVSPESVLKVMKYRDLNEMMSGLQKIDPKFINERMEWTARKGIMQKWMQHYLMQLSQEELRRLLKFITGSERIPHNTRKFDLEVNSGGGSLPTASTCSSELHLPNYRDYESFKKAMDIALTYGADYFGRY